MYKKKKKGKKIDEEPFCRLMCHSDYTAKKWYLRDSLTDQAAEAAEQITSFTKPSPKKRAPERDEQEDQHFVDIRFTKISIPEVYPLRFSGIQRKMHFRHYGSLSSLIF